MDIERLPAPTDPLAPIRGLFYGVVLGIVSWLIIILCLLAVTR